MRNEKHFQLLYLMNHSVISVLHDWTADLCLWTLPPQRVFVISQEINKAICFRVDADFSHQQTSNTFYQMFYSFSSKWWVCISCCKMKIVAASMQLLFRLLCVSFNLYCAFSSVYIFAYVANYSELQVDFL